MNHALRLVAAGATAATALTVAASATPASAATTFIADTLSDNPADGYTFREALADANNAPGADTITFAPGLDGTLTLAGGQLDVTDTVTIKGHDDLGIAISGADSTRIIHSFTPGVSLTVEDLVLSDGNAAFLGGAISFGQGDDLVLDNVDVVRNTTASEGGGGVSVKDIEGTVTITDSLFEANTATGGNGGALHITNHDAGDEILVEATLFIDNTADTGRGGGIDIDGGTALVELMDLDITGNEATVGDVGGVRVRSGFARLHDSTVSDNTAFDDHGGLHITTTVGNAEIERSVIERNTASEAGGGMLDGDGFARMTDVVIRNNTADGVGGFRVTSDSRVIITRATVEDNTASTIMGGLLVLETPELDMKRSTITGNSAPDAGGLGVLNVLEADVFRSTVWGNEATVGSGGGIWASGAAPDRIDLLDSTVSGNVAADDGGGISADSVLVTALESTITDNQAGGVGGGVAQNGVSDLVIESTIIASNTAAMFPDVTGPLNAVYSLLGDTNGVPFLGGGNNLVGVDPQLGPLADNGGPTLTHLPAADSPVIDAGNPAGVTPPGGDQRQFPRPVGVTDIGSVERAGPTSIWIPVTPTRIVDTRTNGETTDGLNEAEGPIGGGTERRIVVSGRAGVPNDAQGVVANITAVSPQEDGFFTVHPCVNPRPFTASLNYTAGVNLGNEVIIGLDSGDVCIFSSGTTQFTVDVVGYVPADSVYTPTDPGRFLDTRAGGTTVDGDFAGQGAPGDDGVIELQIANRGAVGLGTRAVVLYVAAINADRAGFVTVWDCDGDRPLASSLNFAAGTTRGNEIVADLGEGTLCLYTSDRADVTVDVVGYVPGLAFTNLEELDEPSRLLDTRSGSATVDGMFEGGGTLNGGSTLELAVSGRAGIPHGAATVTMNVTAVNPTAVGFLTVYPCGGSLPLAASLNYVPGVNGGNEILASPNDDGEICFFTSADTHLTVDATAATTP